MCRCGVLVVVKLEMVHVRSCRMVLAEVVGESVSLVLLLPYG